MITEKTRKATAKSSTGKKATGNKAPFVEELTPEQTGNIDLHLKSPEDIESTIKKEVAKLNDGFHVVLFDPEQNKKTPREKIAILKDLIVGKVDPENPDAAPVGGYVINGVEDKAGYDRLDNVRKMLVKLRTGVAGKHKLLKENYLKVSRALDTEKNELVGLLSEIETVAEERLDAIDALIKAEEDAKLREKEAKRDARVADIKAAGMEYQNGFYCIGETMAVDIVALENLNDDQFSSLLDRVKKENEKIIFTRKKEAQRQRVNKYLFERQQRAQNAEKQRLKEESDRMKAERRQDRAEALEMLDFKANEAHGFYEYQNGAGKVIVTVDQIENLEGEKWRIRMRDIKTEMQELKDKVKMLEEQEKKNERNEGRKKRLFTAGFIYNASEKYFYLKTEELGITNRIQDSEVFRDDLDFEKWFIEDVLPAVQKVLDENAQIKRKRQEAEELTRCRVVELVNGFGFAHSLGEYFVNSIFSDEPELEGKGLFITEQEIKEMDEQQWSDKIKDFTKRYSDLKQAEGAVKTRKEAAAEADRKALLSEMELVEEYLSALVATPKPVIESQGLKFIVEATASAIQTGWRNLEQLQKEKI